MAMLHVYTGNGKGKTTAALGLAIRAAGHGSKVEIIQFMKSRPTGEKIIIRRMRSAGIRNINLTQFGINKYFKNKEAFGRHLSEAKKGMAYARKLLRERKCNMLILDEINVAVKCGLISAEDAMRFAEKALGRMEVVFTGRGCPEKIIRKADYVTCMKEVKHPFSKDIKARKTIEL